MRKFPTRVYSLNINDSKTLKSLASTRPRVVKPFNRPGENPAIKAEELKLSNIDRAINESTQQNIGHNF